MIRLVLLLLSALRALVRPRSALVLENLALRQQVAALAAKGGRARITGVDRWFWTMLRRCWSRWSRRSRLSELRIGWWRRHLGRGAGPVRRKQRERVQVLARTVR
jgi:hypothetical protein